MRPSTSVISVLAGAAFAAPTTNATVKPKDAAIHPRLLHPNATENFVALLKGYNDTTYLAMHTFDVVVDQRCDKSGTETMIQLFPVLDWRDDTVERPFDDLRIPLSEKPQIFDFEDSYLFASLVKDVVRLQWRDVHWNNTQAIGKDLDFVCLPTQWSQNVCSSSRRYMTTLCALKPIDTNHDKKTLHTLEPRISKTNATRAASNDYKAPSAKQLLAMKAKDPYSRSANIYAFNAVLEQHCDQDFIHNELALGPIINSTGSTVQAAKSVTFIGPNGFIDVLGTPLWISFTDETDGLTYTYGNSRWEDWQDYDVSQAFSCLSSVVRNVSQLSFDHKHNSSYMRKQYTSCHAYKVTYD